MVAGPFTPSDQSFGATKGLPRTVALDVSAERRSDACALTAGLDGTCARRVECRMKANGRNAKLRSCMGTSLQLFVLQLQNRRRDQIIIDTNAITATFYTLTFRQYPR